MILPLPCCGICSAAEIHNLFFSTTRAIMYRVFCKQSCWFIGGRHSRQSRPTLWSCTHCTWGDVMSHGYFSLLLRLVSSPAHRRAKVLGAADIFQNNCAARFRMWTVRRTSKKSSLVLESVITMLHPITQKQRRRDLLILVSSKPVSNLTKRLFQHPWNSVFWQCWTCFSWTIFKLFGLRLMCGILQQLCFPLHFTACTNLLSRVHRKIPKKLASTLSVLSQFSSCCTNDPSCSNPVSCIINSLDSLRNKRHKGCLELRLPNFYGGLVRFALGCASFREANSKPDTLSPGL